MKKIVAVVILSVVVCLCYAPSLRNGFVWDDTALILRDPLIRSWRLIPESFNHFMFIDATPSDFYRPIQRISYTFDYGAVGFRPALYHLTSVVLHAGAAVALFFFAEELLFAFGIDERKRRWLSFLSALAWAIHPVQSAAVVYISGRADPLAAAFGFLGMYLALRASRSTKRNQVALLIGATVAFFLAVLSRESGLIFPLLVIALSVLGKKWIDMWKMIAITAVVCASYFSLRLGAEHYPPPVLSPAPPPLVRPILIARGAAEYAGLLLFPLNLHMDRDVESRPTGMNEPSMTTAAWRELQTLLGIVVIAAVLYWMSRAYKRNFPAFVCLTLLVLGYLPVSGIFSLNATVAEHWLYLPSAFLFLAIAVEAVRFSFSDRFHTRSTITISSAVFLALWILFLGARTFVRTFDWKDQRTFFERTIAAGGDSARMLINLGNLELTEGRLEDAAVHFHSALQKKPDQPFAILDLAAIALKQSDFKLAHDLLDRAAKMPAVEAQAYELLAILENKEHQTVNLLRLRLAAHTGMPIWSIEKRYIQAMDQTGATSAAINELLACLQTQWYRADSWKLLSQLESKVHPDQAANALAQAQRYDVHLDEAK